MSLLRFKKSLGFLSVIPIGLMLTGAAFAAVTSGPARQTFTWASPANFITFNSITDNPTWGDERQIVKVRDVNAPTSAYAPQATVTDNETVVLAVYFHNDAEAGLNLVANNTQVKFALPSGNATTHTATAYITADNATPHQVYATADLTASTPFNLTYETGTAKLYTNYVNGVTVNDSVVGSGALVGSNGPDGNVPGCAQFSGYVTIRARVHYVTTPATTPTPTPTPVTRTTTAPAPKPASLPNTGPGDVLGAFTGASAAGAAGHYIISRRRR